MYVYRSIRHAQWVLRPFIGDAKIVPVRLDPTKSKLRALFDYLDSHQQKKRIVRKGTYITKRTGQLEAPIARCRDTLDGHDLALAHTSNDEAPNNAYPRLAVTVLAVMPRKP